MNIEDNPEVAENLFRLVNMIVDEMITKPREIDELYGSLPEGAVIAIEKRDSSKSLEQPFPPSGPESGSYCSVPNISLAWRLPPEFSLGWPSTYSGLGFALR
jgi:hypothetical protein